MSDEHIRRIIEDSYDASREEGLLSMIRDFYGRRFISSAIPVWIVSILFVGLAVYSAVEFFAAGETKAQIMYAVLFLVGVHGMDLMKIFAWQMIHRRSIKREIKLLELRIAELTESLKPR
jgi:hypothetical protein